MDIQPKILSVLCAIHNFIHIHNPQVEANEAQADLDDDNDDLHRNAGDYMVQGVGYVFVDEVEDGDVAARCNTIAQEMWDDYRVVQETAGHNVNAYFQDKTIHFFFMTRNAYRQKSTYKSKKKKTIQFGQCELQTYSYSPNSAPGLLAPFVSYAI